MGAALSLVWEASVLGWPTSVSPLHRQACISPHTPVNTAACRTIRTCHGSIRELPSTEMVSAGPPVERGRRRSTHTAGGSPQEPRVGGSARSWCDEGAAA